MIDATQIKAVWQTERHPMICPHCDWRFLLSPDKEDKRCPHCHHTELEPLAKVPDELGAYPPEQVLAYTVDRVQLEKSLRDFCGSFLWLSPREFRPQHLFSRVQPIYLPMWLVDAEIQGQWQVEAGFDYEVVTHEEALKDKQWRSREVRRTQVRWEPRIGTMERRYDNVPAPALENEMVGKRPLLSWLQPAAKSKSSPYQPTQIGAGTVALPIRPPSDAITTAEAGFAKRAAAESRQAIAADHVRQFRWSPEFVSQNWTLRLIPAYATYYRNEDGTIHPILIHGQSAEILGEKHRSSHWIRWILLGMAGLIGLIMLCCVLMLLLLFFVPT